MTLLRALTRGHWLVALTAMAAAWGYTGGGSSLGGGGWVAVVALGATVLLWFALFDQSMLERAGEARLSLSRGRGSLNVFELTPATTVFAAAAVLLSLITLLVDFWVGLAFLVTLGAVALLWVKRRPAGEPKSFVGLEWEIAACAVLLPFLLMRGLDDGGATTAALCVTLGLGVWMLLCVVRDETGDGAALNATTATALGRVGASWLAIGALALMIVFAAGAASAGVWGWAVPALISIAALVVVWSLATRGEENAVPVWAGVCVFTALIAGASLEAPSPGEADTPPAAQSDGATPDEDGDGDEEADGDGEAGDETNEEVTETDG